jgi:hypothetical protein
MSTPEQPEVKEWVKVAHSPSGTIATCTMVSGNLSAKWSVRAPVGTIAKGVAQARKQARRALTELEEAMTG